MKIKYYNRVLRKDSGNIRDGTNNHHLHIFVEENQKNLHREGDNRIESWDIYVVLPKGVGHPPPTPTKKDNTLSKCWEENIVMLDFE